MAYALFLGLLIGPFVAVWGFYPEGGTESGFLLLSNICKFINNNLGKELVSSLWSSAEILVTMGEEAFRTLTTFVKSVIYWHE
ncbi:unnamed protein product [Knipowitschia caucasica]